MRIVFLIFFMSFALVAQGATKQLTPKDVERVKAYKLLLRDVDTKTIQQTVKELESTEYPQLNLQIKETIAKAYVDIAREYKITEAKKSWLYSMVTLNMAYLQFGGGNSNADTSLSKLILRKLKEYLPPDVANHRGFHYSLG